MSRAPKILASLPVKTQHGIFTAHYSDVGLAALNFPQSSAGRTASGSVEPRSDLSPASGPRESDPHSLQIELWHELTTEALQNALSNQPAGKLPPLDLSAGTEFQQRVWQALLKIKSGFTVSYGELAESIGDRQAVRAVGGACGANPIPVLIPCHRVLAANKKIGGFSGGLDWKRLLLNLENPQIFSHI